VRVCSCEEADVCSAHSLVWISNGGEDPLSESLSLSVRAEEVVEDCGVYWHDGLLLEIVVVGLDLWGTEVV